MKSPESCTSKLQVVSPRAMSYSKSSYRGSRKSPPKSGCLQPSTSQSPKMLRYRLRRRRRRLRANTAMFVPILPLMLRRTILGNLTLATYLPPHRRNLRLPARLRRLAPIRRPLLIECDITVNPVTHLPRSHLAESVGAPPF